MNQKNIKSFMVSVLILIIFSMPLNADILNYVGNKELCITNVTGNFTCIQKTEHYTYGENQEYLLEIRDIPIEKTSNSLLYFLENKIIDIAFILVLLVCVIGVGIMFVRG